MEVDFVTRYLEETRTFLIDANLPRGILNKTEALPQDMEAI